MQEISGSLSEVIRAYSDHNLLVPAATDVQLNPFYKYHVEEVAVDLSENSGDIFKVGSVKTGKTDSKGNDIWQDTYSLSKPLLNKLAKDGTYSMFSIEGEAKRVEVEDEESDQ